jgi:hypothetical protein
VGTEKRERQKANRAQKLQQEAQVAKRRTTLRYVGLGVGAVAAVFLIAWIASIVTGDDDEPATPTVPSLPAVTLPETPVVSPPETPVATVPGTIPTGTIPTGTIPAETVGG